MLAERQGAAAAREAAAMQRAGCQEGYTAQRSAGVLSDVYLPLYDRLRKAVMRLQQLLTMYGAMAPSCSLLQLVHHNVLP